MGAESVLPLAVASACQSQNKHATDFRRTMFSRLLSGFLPVERIVWIQRSVGAQMTDWGLEMLSDLLQPLDSCFKEHQGVGAREPLVDRGFRQTGLGPNGHKGCVLVAA